MEDIDFSDSQFDVASVHWLFIILPLLKQCPDKIILFDEKNKDYGLIIHDGGTSSIGIDFCPWCGAKL
ncbi:DUF6980 family protein [Oceanobacillus halophilus]|uniref:DUF6980 family protein n=1 Tax=Oceanobacillus halophilus TaxID=930130 RepID=UPI003BA8B180